MQMVGKNMEEKTGGNWKEERYEGRGRKTVDARTVWTKRKRKRKSERQRERERQ